MKVGMAVEIGFGIQGAKVGFWVVNELLTTSGHILATNWPQVTHLATKTAFQDLGSGFWQDLRIWVKICHISIFIILAAYFSASALFSKKPLDVFVVF